VGTPSACRASNYFTHAAAAHHAAFAAELSALLAAFPAFALYITGHSLGGAMAGLSALRLVTEGVVGSTRVQLYTFGMPRCGDFAFAQHVKRLVPNTFRVVYRADPVAHTPQCKSAPTPDVTKKLFGECVAATSFLEPLWAFHFGTEVWYPPYGFLSSGSGMPDIRYASREDDPKAAALPQPTLCTGAPFGEDEACSNAMANSAGGLGMNALDHLSYFSPEHSTVKLSEVCMNKVQTKAVWRQVVSMGLGVLLSVSLSGFCLVCVIYCFIRRARLRNKKAIKLRDREELAKNPTASETAVKVKRKSRAKVAV